MSASSGYPPLFQPSTAFAVTTLQIPPSIRPRRTLRDVVGALWRQWRLVLGGAAVALAAAAALRAAMPPVYVATATVLLQPEPRGLVAGDAAQAPGAAGAGTDADAADGIGRRPRAEIALMRNRLNAQAAVERLDLHAEQLAAPGLAGLVDLVPGLRSADEPVDVASERARTVDRFMEALAIDASGASAGGRGPDVLRVRLACTDRWIAPRALQAFVDSYLALAARHQRQAVTASSRVLEGRIADAHDALRRSEDAIVGLLVGDAGRPLLADPPRAGTVADRADPGRPAAVPMALRLDEEPATTAAAAAAASSRRFAAGDATSAGAASPAPTAPGLRLDESPPVPEDDLAPASASAGPAREPGRPEAAPLGATVPVRADTPLGVQLARLEQQRAAAQDRYVELQRQRDRLDSLLASPTGDPAPRLLLDAPRRPTTVEGARPSGLVLPAVMLGLLAGIVLALVRELGGDRLRSARDVRWALGVPVLGALPTLSARSRQALVGAAFSAGARLARDARDARDDE